MSSESNKAIVRTFVERAQSRGDFAAIDEMLADDFIDHSALPGMPPDREGVRILFGVLRSAFPDLQAIVHDQVAEGDKVVTRKTLRGTHRGEFMGVPPTGKTVELGVIDVLRIENGKLKDHWAQVDMFGLMHQIGALPGA